MDKKLVFALLACLLPLTACGGERGGDTSKPAEDSSSVAPTDAGQIDDVTGNGDHYGGVEQSGTVGLTYTVTSVQVTNPETKEVEWKDGYKVTGYVGSSANVVIPAEFNGKPVYQIDERAFQNNLVMESIRLGKNVVSIREFAFSRTWNLKKVELDRENTFFTIEEGMVYHIERNEDKEITKKVLYFGEAGRYISFDTPKLNITELAIGCLGNQENLMYLRVNIDTFPGSYRRLSYLFNSASSTPRYYIDRMKNAYVPHLATIVLTGAGENAGGILTTDFAKNLYSLTSLIIEEGVVEIGESAFNGCLRLRNVEVISSVKRIRHYAFQECKDLYKMWLYKPSNGTLTLDNYVWWGDEYLVVYARGAESNYSFTSTTFEYKSNISLARNFNATYATYESRIAYNDFSPIPPDPVAS